MSQMLRVSRGDGVTRRGAGVSRGTDSRSHSDSAAIQHNSEVPAFIPFLQKTYLPFDYFVPAEKKIYIHDVGKEQFFTGKIVMLNKLRQL